MRDIDIVLQLYCCQWLGKDYIICGGNEQNMARIIDRGTLNVRTYHVLKVQPS